VTVVIGEKTDFPRVVGDILTINASTPISGKTSIRNIGDGCHFFN
jgi:hypothetical protein